MYELLWSRRSALGPRWLGRAARLLRAEDAPISSAHVSEACRLADTLATRHERPVASLGGRLRILGVEWALPAPAVGRSKGTFHEHWLVRWMPEFALTLIEASRYGHTILSAAGARVIQDAEGAAALPELVKRLEDPRHRQTGCEASGR